MKVAFCQIAPTVGDFAGNLKKIRTAFDWAVAQGADIVLTPELAVCGYPPHDLIERSEMLERNEQAIAELASATAKVSTALVVGHVGRNTRSTGRPSLNQASVLAGGKILFSQAKSLLPTYDVFDEGRYFEPAESIGTFEWKGKKFALAICEDLWGSDVHFGRRLYGKDPVDSYAKAGVAAVLCISASPYEYGKRAHREGIHGEVARHLHAPIAYLNQTGATDEILFDGSSFVVTETGKVTERLPYFREENRICDLFSAEKTAPASDPGALAELHAGLVTGIREYFEKTGGKQAIVGLSGGIDSAVVAALCAEALGPKRLLGIAMPGPFSTPHSLEDAEALAKTLGCEFEVRSIKFMYASLLREFGGDAVPPVAVQNLQSRLRGLILMQRANAIEHSLVVTTGNKSEFAMGYCTLYGDMVGAIAPIGDLFKTRVYELAEEINRKAPLIPKRTLTKAPSAELAPGQKDEDSLPPYEVLDPLLAAYIEEGASLKDLEKRGSRDGKGLDPRFTVRGILAKLEAQEFKRRQAALVFKASPKAFGIGRRVPVAKVWYR